MRVFILIPLIFCCLVVKSQVTFEKTYPSFSSGYSIQQLPNGKYIGCGDSVTYGYIYQLDRFGNLLTSNIPRLRNRYITINDITRNPVTSGYAICGYGLDTTGNGATGYFLLLDSLFHKTDSVFFTGGTNGPSAQIIQRTPANNFMVGLEEYLGIGSYTSKARRVNYPATASWSAPGGANLAENGLALDSSGNTIIGGFSWVGAASAEAYLYDPSGVLQQTFSITDTAYGGSYVYQSVVAPSPNGKYMIGVQLTPFSSGYDLPYIAQLDDSLHVVWEKYLDWESYLTIEAIIPTKDSCIVLLLSTDNGIALHKMNASGDSLWTQYHQRLQYAFGNRIRQCADRGFIITGDFYDTTANYGYVLKTDSLGRLLPPTNLVVGGPTKICPGDSVQLAAPAGYQYLWSTGDTTRILWAKQALNYWVRVTGANSLFAYSDTIHVTLFNTQTPAITNTSNVLSTSGTGSFQWYFYGNPISGANTSSYTPTLNGEYTVALTDSNGCRVFSAIYTVSFIPTSNIQVIGSTQICPGDSVRLLAPPGVQFHWSTGATTNTIWAKLVQGYWVTVTDTNSFTYNTDTVHITFFNTQTPVVSSSNNVLTTTGTGTYKWYRNGILISGATASSYTATQSGNYTAAVTDGNGCTVLSAPYNLVYIPTQIQVNGSTTICPGDSVQLSAAAGFNYLWSTGATTRTIWVSQAQSYWATISDGSGHSVHSDTVTITISNTQTPVITASGNTLTSTGIGTFQWYFYGNIISNATASTYTPTLNGDYLVALTDNNGCTVLSASYNVSFIPTTTIQVIGSTQICPGDSVRLLAPPGVQYVWSTGATTNLIWASQVQGYWVTVTDTNSFTYNTDTVYITLFNTQTPVVTGANNVLSATGSGTFQWYLNGVMIPGANAASYLATQSGNYSVVLTDSNGCRVLSATYTLVYIPTALQVNGAVDICPGDSVQISAPAGYSYLWSTGDTTQSIWATQPQNYWTTITDANLFFVQSDTVSIDYFNLQTPVITNTNNLLTATGVGSLQWYFNGLIITGADSSSYPATQNGDYTVALIDSNGCVVVSSPFNFIFNSVDVIEDVVRVFDSETALTISSDQVLGHIMVIDISGRVLLNRNADKKVFTIDKRKLAKGIYTIIAARPTGERWIRQFVY